MAPLRNSVSLLAVLACANYVAAQTLPACADACYYGFTSSGTLTTTSCDALDIDCICKDDDYLDSQICCLHEECSDSDREEAESYVKSICSAVGVSLPGNLACPSSLASATTKTAVASATSADTKETVTEVSGGSNTAGGSVVTVTAGGVVATVTSSSGDDSSGDDSGSYGGSSSSSHSSYSHHHSSGKTLKTALGVAIGVGVPLIASVLGGFAWWKKKNKGAAAPPTQPAEISEAAPPSQQPPPFQQQTQAQYNQPPAPSYGYPPQDQHYPPQQQGAFIPPYEKNDGVVTAMTTPSPIQELSTPQYQQQQHNELVGTTPSPMHELLPQQYQPPQHSELAGNTPQPIHEMPANVQYQNYPPQQQTYQHPQ